jgi:hypothetical protein
LHTQLMRKSWERLACERLWHEVDDNVCRIQAQAKLWLSSRKGSALATSASTHDACQRTSFYEPPAPVPVSDWLLSQYLPRYATARKTSSFIGIHFITRNYRKDVPAIGRLHRSRNVATPVEELDPPIRNNGFSTRRPNSPPLPLPRRQSPACPSPQQSQRPPSRQTKHVST